jgi:acyl-[acyl-carrier-protein]-phospholipid O-acyltransferase/long-chain-fatty-acid--[acyl-carrier-protein] ligase
MSASAANTELPPSRGARLKWLPRQSLRLLHWFVLRVFYKVRVIGRENLPERGGALLVCNHLSYADPFFVAAATRRNIRFLMFDDYYSKPIIRQFAGLFDAIPISGELRPREMVRALREASDSVRRGELVCIFAEGEISRLGRLLPFRRGMERIMKDIDAPVIPMHLEGLWSSIFSFERGRAFFKVPRRVPLPITVSYGKPVSSRADSNQVRAAVQELEAEAFMGRKGLMQPLHRSFVQRARTVPFRFCMADARSGSMNFASALIKAVFLARALYATWKTNEAVGILLPPSIAGALVNMAATLAGKRVVNFNYTASNELISEAARQTGIQITITSRAFLERLSHIQPPGDAVLLEDVVLAFATQWNKLTSGITALVFPIAMLERYCHNTKRPQMDDLATVIFSSGSTGDPKGVMLSHFNVAANVEQAARAFSLTNDDRVLGILPFFHSFGYTICIWLPVTLGAGVVYHPDPFDAGNIGELVAQYCVTFLVATPTFLLNYLRRIPSHQFGSLRYVIVGAEKLQQRLADKFAEKFGIRPLEGYGCTECSPVVAANTLDYRGAGLRQIGGKPGKIGHPLPGMAVKVVDPDTRQPLNVNVPGLLLVKGPNVMQGYLGREDLTRAVLQGGWYNTGDIVSVDEDGFLAITDRLSRFSKVGGEMVPHIRIEESLQNCAHSAEQVFAVTALPDEKRGERLVVLHLLEDEALKRVLDCFYALDLPPLWKPKRDHFIRAERIPYLGTGKVDLRRVKEMAVQLTTAENPA